LIRRCEFLIELLDGTPPEVAAEAHRSLSRLTGRRHATKREWDEWWQRNRDRGPLRVLAEALRDIQGSIPSLDSERERMKIRLRALMIENLKLKLELARKNGKPEAPALVLRDDLARPDLAEIRDHILDEIAALGRDLAAPALPEAIRALDDPDGRIVVAALRCLQKIGEESAADAVARFLDPRQERDVRKAAAEAAAEIATPNLTPPLVNALTDEKDLEVLLLLVRGVKTVRAHAAVPHLRRFLTDYRGQADLMKASIEALGEIGDPEGVRPLIEFLAASDAEKDRGARWAAAASLGKLGQAAAVEALVKLIHRTTHPSDHIPAGHHASAKPRRRAQASSSPTPCGTHGRSGSDEA